MEAIVTLFADKQTIVCNVTRPMQSLGVQSATVGLVQNAAGPETPHEAERQK
jgi:hypothetical protein